MIKTGSQKKIFVSILIFLLGAGVFARFIDLDNHFTHIDDLGVARTVLQYQTNLPELAQKENITNPVLVKLFQLTAVPRHWTYAPLQFFATSFLINSGQTYREILFWGRLPSFLFGMLGILLMLCFYRRYDGFKTTAGLVAAALLVFSWENIIYAKQMESYAIGVFAAAGMLVLLWDLLKPEALTLRRLLVSLFLLAVLSHAQYQVLFFVPAFFSAVLFYHAKRSYNELPSVLLKLAAGILFYGSLVFPMIHFFLLKQKATAGVTWNVGLHQEFQFLLPQSASLLQQAWYSLSFFLKNSFLILGSNFGFIPENHPLFFPVSLFLTALFLTGVIAYARTPILRKKTLGQFFLLSALTWAALVVLNKITLSPTRHSLILLPFMAVITAEGWNQTLHKLKRPGQSASLLLTSGLIGFIAVSFFIYFKPMAELRRDPFREPALEQLFEEYKVDSVIATDYTIPVSFMKNILARYNYFESETMTGPVHDRIIPFQGIAFLSHRGPFSQARFEMMRFKINLYQNMTGRRDKLITGNFGDYEVVYSEEIASDTQVDFSSRTQNGPNSFSLTILRKKN